MQKNWQKEEVFEFFGKLSNAKRLDPLVQFVVTGFNKDISSSVRESGAKFKCLSLTLYDFSSSKPLLREIIRAYREVHIPVFMQTTNPTKILRLTLNSSTVKNFSREVNDM